MVKKSNSADLNIQSNGLEREMEWANGVLESLIKSFEGDEFSIDKHLESIPAITEKDDDPYCNFVKDNALNPQERLIVILAFIAEFRPGMLLRLFRISNNHPDIGFFEFGNGNQIGITIRTIMFILTAKFQKDQFAPLLFFDADHKLIANSIIDFIEPSAFRSKIDQLVVLAPDSVSQILWGHETKPGFSTNFPAHKLTTGMEWKDLVLESSTLSQVMEIQDWIDHKQALYEDLGMKRSLKPGFRALFHGPPGTGKTLTASLLGKFTDRDVFRIDLSSVVSKYIGETEKNLSRIFDKAEHKNWILFFDEADALFGKRAKVSDARDRYANQEVSYLLQRIENLDGLVILASNFKSNMDDAFLRRFQSVVYFPPPGHLQRLQIYQNLLPPKLKMGNGVDLDKIAQKFEVSGGAILNIVQFVSMAALKRGDRVLSKADFFEGIRRELLKEGKIIGA